MTYFATCAALPVLRRQASAGKAAFILPGGMIIAPAAILLICWLLTNCTLREVRDTAIALAAGLILYALNHATVRKQRKDILI